jgi:hypothetical protein
MRQLRTNLTAPLLSLTLAGLLLVACTDTWGECAAHDYSTCPGDACAFDDANERCLEKCANAEPACPDGFACELVDGNDCSDARDTACETQVVSRLACVPD